jgi:hypothetical protein
MAVTSPERGKEGNGKNLYWGKKMWGLARTGEWEGARWDKFLHLDD